MEGDTALSSPLLAQHIVLPIILVLLIVGSLALSRTWKRLLKGDIELGHGGDHAAKTSGANLCCTSCSSPPPPPPPPPPPRPHFPALPAALPAAPLYSQESQVPMTGKLLRSSLAFENIRLDDTGNIELTGQQYNILFTADDAPPYNVPPATKVSLFRLAGEVALYKKSPNKYMNALAARLVPEMQGATARLTVNEAAGFNQVKVVNLLYQNVVLQTQDSGVVRGVLEGYRKNFNCPGDVYNFKILGEEPYEVPVNLSAIYSGAAKMWAAEKEDPPAYQTKDV